jgi:hypothetical protein
LVLLQVVKDGLHPKRLMISGLKHKLGNFSRRRARNRRQAFTKATTVPKIPKGLNHLAQRWTAQPTYAGFANQIVTTGTG